MLESRYFELICAIADSGSLHKASEKLYISQPAISTSLSKLENKLGVTLFERCSTGIRPTPVCESLLPLAKDIVDKINSFSTICNDYSLLAIQGLPFNDIVFSATPEIFNTLKIDVFAQLKTILPELEVHFNYRNCNETTTPKDNEIIILMKTSDYTFPKEIEYKNICEVKPAILLHKDLLQSTPTYFDAETIVDFPIITVQSVSFSPSSISYIVINSLKSKNKNLKIINVPSRSICNSYLKKKLGVSLVLSFGNSPIKPPMSLITVPFKMSTEQSPFHLAIIYNAKYIPDSFITIFSSLLHESVLGNLQAQ